MACNYDFLMEKIKAIVVQQDEVRETMKDLVRTITAEHVLPSSSDKYTEALEEAYYKTGLGPATPKIARRESRMRRGGDYK